MPGPIQERPSNWDAMVEAYNKSQDRGRKALMEKYNVSTDKELIQLALEANKARSSRSVAEHKPVSGEVIIDPESSAIHSLKSDLVKSVVTPAITHPEEATAHSLKGRVSAPAA